MAAGLYRASILRDARILRQALRSALLVRNLGLGGGPRPLGRANRPLSSGGEWLDFDGIAKVFKALHQALGLRDLGTAVDMVGTEILVDGSVFEHVIDGGENGGGDGTWAHCASKSAGVLPSRSAPTWPAMNRNSDALTRVICEYCPSGLPRPSGLSN